MFSSPLSFVFCSPVLPHSTTMSPCLLFVSQIFTPSPVSTVFLSISAVLFYSSGNHPCLPKSWSPLVQMLLDSLPPSVSTILSLALLSLPFSFSPREPFCIPPYGVALRRTHLPIPYNRTFPSGSSFLTIAHSFLHLNTKCSL